jgi:apolipoprotein N-acyltransferase
MNSRIGSVAIKIAVAAGAGVLLRFAAGLRPVWWVVWLAPIPLLLIAIRIRSREARWMVLLAAVIGTSCNYHYFRVVMPLPGVIAAIAAQTLLWGFLIFATQRVVVRYKAWWTVLAYPGRAVA